MKRSGLSQEIEKLPSDFNSQIDSQTDLYEEMEGIADQLLIGRDEECRSLQIDQPTECIAERYKSFIDYLITQLPPSKRKHAENQYEALESSEGK